VDPPHIEAAERLTAFFVFVEKNMDGLSDKLRANGMTKFYVTSVFNKNDKFTVGN
jgi:hypothetical protein